MTSPALPRGEEGVTKEENFEVALRNETGMPLVLMKRRKWMQAEERRCSQDWRSERNRGG